LSVQLLTLEPGTSTLSFDVFDTVITRVWYRPIDLFIAVGRELVQSGLRTGAPEAWAVDREATERELRRRLRCANSVAAQEVSLGGIYDALAARLQLSPAVRAAAMETELRLEVAASRPIAAMHAFIAAAQAAGKRVMFLSDTYFEREFVASLLLRAGLTLAPSSLFTSLATGYTKHTGSLYVHVLASRSLLPSEIQHVGDNVVSDVNSARRIGIRAAQFDLQLPTRYEKRLYAPHETIPRLVRSTVAGAARSARLGASETDPRHQVLAETGADVAGPILTGFVLWVLIEAQRRGLTRLYFLARDGQILQQIAERLVAWLGWSIELRYLYASRQSLFLPSITAFDDAAREWFFERSTDMSIRAILARIELDPDDEAALLGSAGFPSASWDRPLGPGGHARLQALARQPYFIECALAQARSHRTPLLEYLMQQGLLEGRPFGLVDIGWKGRLQRCLAQTLSTIAHRPVPIDRLTGFYFGLERRPDPAIAGELVAFVNAPLPNAALLETFVKADHGSVRRFYRDRTGLVQPELSAARDIEAIEWGLPAQQAGIVAFVEHLLSALKPADVSPHSLVDFLRDRGRVIFDLFTHFPRPHEAAAYGSLHHASDQTHANPRDTAPLVTGSLLPRIFLQRHAELETQTSWPQGSIARSTSKSDLTRRSLLWLLEARRLVGASLRG
jgi:predicted HAD superfamily hydrolase